MVWYSNFRLGDPMDVTFVTGAASLVTSNWVKQMHSASQIQSPNTSKHSHVVISRHHSHQRHHYQNHHHHLQCDQIAISSLLLSPRPSPGPSPVISHFATTFPHLPNPSHRSGHLSGSCNLCHWWHYWWCRVGHWWYVAPGRSGGRLHNGFSNGLWRC